LVERIVRDHPYGSVPAKGVLDTPEKIRGHAERMKAATQEQLREDRRARQKSAARARTDYVD
jgi:hypothetical protein